MFAFNSDLSKKNIDGKILDWEDIYKPSQFTTKTFSSTTSEVATNIVTNWANWSSGWDEYDFVKVTIYVSDMSYGKYSSTTPYATLTFGDVTAFDTEIPTGSSTFELDTSGGNYEFHLFFERGRVNFRANGAEVASFYDGLGNEKDPYSGLNPVMHHKGCTNGTITFRIDIAGAKM